MKLIIYRGANEIGGTCVELSTDTNRIIIDFGMPLVNAKNEKFDSIILNRKSIGELKELKILPVIKGLYQGAEKGIDAVIISHSHLDHYGLLNYIHKDIPIYMSYGAKELIGVSNIFTPIKMGEVNIKIINSKQPLVVGDMKVTPYTVDHSAFDALAFLIEAQGKRIFYSGDFRGHGRKGRLFRKIIVNPPKNIDCLLMEGSTLGREDACYKTEGEVEKRLEEVLLESKNITFLFASPQNIDRIVSAYRACLKTNSIFVIDIYTAFILDKLKRISKRIPQFNWKNVRVKFIFGQRQALLTAGLQEAINIYGRRAIGVEEINKVKNKVLMLARDNSVFPLLLNKLQDVIGAKIAYSMWSGYLSEEFKAFCRAKGLAIEYVHISGHAYVKDLQAFACALKPKVLIPVHTFFAGKYRDLFNNVKVLRDGEVLTV